jgi:hypothetical protein
MPRVEVMPFLHREGNITVAADPYVQPERSEVILGRNLSKLGVISIQLALQNQGQGSVFLQPLGIALILPDGTELSPMQAIVVATKELRAEFSGARLLLLPLAVPPSPGYFAVMFQIAHDKDLLVERITDYWTKELKDAVVHRDELVHGFVFFMPNEDTSPFDEATLVCNLLNVAEARRFTVRMHLTGLGFKGVSSAAK